MAFTTGVSVTPTSCPACTSMTSIWLLKLTNHPPVMAAPLLRRFSLLRVLLHNHWRNRMPVAPHLYRYDLESFVWFIHWMCYRHEPILVKRDAALRGSLFSEWTISPRQSYNSKFSWMSSHPFNDSIPPISAHAEHWQYLGKPWTAAAHRQLFWTEESEPPQQETKMID